MTGAIFRLTAVLAIATGWAACASGPARPTAPARSPDQVSLQLFAALERDDLPAATKDFSPKLGAALGSFEMRQIWQELVGTYGPLRDKAVLHRISRDGLEVREIALRFQRGAAIGRVAVDPSTERVEGLFFRPATPADLQGPAAGSTPDVPGVRSQPVVIGQAPWKLPGTLARPVTSGPFPAVLLVHGSGPQDRDEAVGPNRPFRDIAEQLARAGIASLRYDKRTLVYRGQLDAQKVTVEEEVIADAQAALQFLRSQPGIRSDGLFIVGHSLGAMLTPIIAERTGGVAGLILLAPPSRSMPRAIVEQARVVGKFTPAQLQEMEQQAERITSGKAGPTETFLGVPVNYFRDLMARDGFAAARRVSRPVLLLRGERDYQVLAEEHARWKQALAGLPVESHQLARLNHHFIAGDGPPGPEDYGRPGRVDGSVTTLVSAFVNKVLAARTSGP